MSTFVVQNGGVRPPPPRKHIKHEESSLTLYSRVGKARGVKMCLLFFFYIKYYGTVMSLSSIFSQFPD
jgi:hypothetical protein